MVLGLTKTYTPIDGQVAVSASYNTDISALFDAFSGLEAQTSTLGKLTLKPSSNKVANLNVQNAASSTIFSVDTVNSQIKTNGDKLWGLIYDNTLTSQATEWDVTGLNGNSDQIYDVVIRIKSSQLSALYLKINEDSGSNYYTQQKVAQNTTVTASRTSASGNGFLLYPTGISPNDYIMCKFTLYAVSGYLRKVEGFTCFWDESGSIMQDIFTVSGTWDNSADNITSLNFYTIQAWGVGSSIQVFARR